MQKDHFKIDGPAVISFSGGRTSGLMLRRCLDAGLQPDVHVLFANTGKERPETLDFVRDCGLNWGVLKGRETRLKIIRENPELSAWWIRMEQETSQPFRAHSMNYRELADHARRNPTLFDLLKSQEDGIIDCMCGE